MEMKEVTSSNVKSVGWENNTLRVEFKNNAVYEYADVPEEVYNSLLNSNSVGSYLRQIIIGVYESTKL